MLVEFLGVPGSGKSTIARRLASNLLDQGLPVEETTFDLYHRRGRAAALWARLLSASRFVLLHPLQAMGDAAAIWSTGQASRLGSAKSLFNWLFTASLAARRRRLDRPIILDQGVAQALWSVGFEATHLPALSHFHGQVLRTGLRPDLVIYVKAAPDQVGSRLAVRTDGASRLDGRSLKPAVLDRAALICEAVARALREHSVPMIEVSNDDEDQLHAAVEVATAAVFDRRWALTNAGGPASSKCPPHASAVAGATPRGAL